MHGLQCFYFVYTEVQRNQVQLKSQVQYLKTESNNKFNFSIDQYSRLSDCFNIVTVPEMVYLCSSIAKKSKNFKNCHKNISNLHSN